MTGSRPDIIDAVHAGIAKDSTPDASLRSAVESFVVRAQEAWPSVPAPSHETLVACILAVGCTTTVALTAIEAGELWLAASCAAGERAGLQVFDEHYIARLRPALRAMDLDDNAIEELQQRIRHRLLTAGPGAQIRLLEYAGKGRLFGLVKVVAIRMALDDIRRHQRAPDARSSDALTVERLMDGDLGPELAVVETQHRGAVKDAFEAAVEALPARDRAILRMHLLDSSSIDEIAALHDVHRATAARWILRIRERLAGSTRTALQTRLALSADRLESLLLAVQSRLDLSLSRILAPSQPSDDAPSEDG